MSRSIAPATPLLVALGALALAGCNGASPSPNDAARDVASDAASTDAALDVVRDAGPPVPVVGPCNQNSAEGRAGCVQRTRYAADLNVIASARVPGSTHWQTVQNLCASRFMDLGYTVERQTYATGTNVIGVLPGGARARERVLISAHYDAVPDCPGADDNGTGVAGVLEAANALAHGSYARTLVVACWDEEERGLIGSRAYAARARERAETETIVGNFVFEMIGYTSSEPNSQRVPEGLGLLFPRQVAAVRANQFRGDFIALITDVHNSPASEDFALFARAVGLPVQVFALRDDIKLSDATGTLRRSDHAAFWENNFPGAMVTDTAEFRNAHYHCMNGADTVDVLDTGFATKVVQATVGAAARALAGP